MFKDTGGEMSLEHPRSSSLVSFFFFISFETPHPATICPSSKVWQGAGFPIKSHMFFVSFLKSVTAFAKYPSFLTQMPLIQLNFLSQIMNERMNDSEGPLVTVTLFGAGYMYSWIRMEGSGFKVNCGF